MVDKQLFVFGLIIMFAMFLGSAITYEIMGQQIKIEKQNTNLEKVYSMNGYEWRGHLPIWGTFFPKTQTFCIYGQDQNETDLIRSSLHEIGHYLDWRAKKPVLDENSAITYANSWQCEKKDVTKIIEKAFKKMQMYS